MEVAGRIVEAILNYMKEGKSVKRADIKDKFGLEEEDAEQILQFLVTLKLIGIDRNEVLQVYKKVNMVKLKLMGEDDQIKITEFGLGFLQL
ncbi:unnamed protein product [marine sediment metagenome]|uniref:Uncharacterized protein n=1 Tax=marine sediment metagenome TaxID=412755 RepID=X1KBK8_9ZZZZ